MRTLFLALLGLATAGCAHRMALPLPESASDSCSFSVLDDRPDPQHLYAKAQTVIQIQTVPTIAESVKGAVCAITAPHLANHAMLTITDFSCTASGFITITYVVELRGLLAKANAKPLEVRAGKKIDTTEGYIPGGCEKAAMEAIPLFAKRVRDGLGG